MSDRQYTWVDGATAVVTLAFISFVCWTTVVGPYPNIQQRAIVLALTFAIGILCYPTATARLPKFAARVVDLALLVITIVACAYVTWNYQDIMMDVDTPSVTAVVLGIMLVVVIIEMSRRAIGISFGVLIFLFAAYAIWGHLIPGRIGHAYASPTLLVDTLYLGTDGIWGSLLDIYARLLVLFVVFSSLMMATDAGATFMSIGKLIAGRMTGGPAKIAVISSALVGSVTGSSVTNVAMTGSFTIPMMKRMGYRPEVAAAIEATASSGGQITPPMMGAGLFLMAEFLGKGVGEIMVVAAVPALLFYISVMASVHCEAAREGMGGLSSADLRADAEAITVRTLLPLAVPFFSLIGCLAMGYSAAFSVFAAVVTIILAYVVCAPSRSDVWVRCLRVVGALADCARPLAIMGALMAAAATVVSIIGFFGIGPKLSEMVLQLGGSSIYGVLLMSGLVVMVLGMGMPTTAAYVLGIAVISSTLQKLGVDVLSAHMFVFYFATLSALTPPVCAAVFVAAGIAECPWFGAALQTVRFALIKYFLPFIFVLHPVLLQPGMDGGFFFAFVGIAVGAIGMSAALAGYLFSPLSKLEAALLFVGAVLVLWPDLTITLVGVAPMGYVILASALKWKRSSRAVPAPDLQK